LDRGEVEARILDIAVKVFKVPPETGLTRKRPSGRVADKGNKRFLFLFQKWEIRRSPGKIGTSGV